MINGFLATFPSRPLGIRIGVSGEREWGNEETGCVHQEENHDKQTLGDVALGPFWRPLPRSMQPVGIAVVINDNCKREC